MATSTPGLAAGPTASVSVFVYTFAVLILTLFIFFLGVLSSIDGTWENWEQGGCFNKEFGCFCETPRDGLVRQPANSWSNIAYIFAGLRCSIQGVKHAQNRIAKHSKKDDDSARRVTYGLSLQAAVDPVFAQYDLDDMLANTYFLSTLVLGFGSLFLHVSLTLWGEFVDNAGMYQVIICMLLYNRHSLRITARKDGSSKDLPLFPEAWQFFIEYVFVSWGTLHVMYKSSETVRSLFFPLLIFATIAYEIHTRKYLPHRCAAESTQWFKLAISSLVAAATGWVLDVRHIVCVGDSLFQLHALWHVLTAFSLYAVYQYFAQPQVKQEAQKSRTDSEQLIRASFGFTMEYSAV